MIVKTCSTYRNLKFIRAVKHYHQKSLFHPAEGKKTDTFSKANSSPTSKSFLEAIFLGSVLFSSQKEELEKFSERFFSRYFEIDYIFFRKKKN